MSDPVVPVLRVDPAEDMPQAGAGGVLAGDIPLR